MYFSWKPARMDSNLQTILQKKNVFAQEVKNKAIPGKNFSLCNYHVH